MGLNAISLEIVRPYLGGSVLSLGYPHLSGVDSMIENIITDAGGSLYCVDLFQHLGFETICDLNQPNKFPLHDLVIDPGTIEHCMNIGIALINAASAVKVGGRIFHGSPMTMLNHGYYNICPTLYADFYELNGFKIEVMESRDYMGTGAIVPIEWRDRFGGESNAGLYCMAQRVEEKRFVFPTQLKYKTLHGPEMAASK